MPKAPPHPPSSLTLVSAETFLLHFFLTSLTAVWYFLPYLTYTFSEASPSWLRGSAVPCGESIGATWNQLCPSWDIPGLSSQRTCLQTPHCQHLGICIQCRHFVQNFENKKNILYIYLNTANTGKC